MVKKINYFPYKVRPIQDNLMQILNDFFNSDKKTILIEAPTGLGKTVSVLSTALEYSKKIEKLDIARVSNFNSSDSKSLNSKKNSSVSSNHQSAVKNSSDNLDGVFEDSDDNGHYKDIIPTIFFVTSRNTQALIATDTAKDINNILENKITAINFVGKSNMCLYNFKKKIQRDSNNNSFSKGRFNFEDKNSLKNQKLFFSSDENSSENELNSVAQNLKLKQSNSLNKDFLDTAEQLSQNQIKSIDSICARLKENGSCIYFNKTYSKNKLSTESKMTLNNFKNSVILPNNLKSYCIDKSICPYELAIKILNKSNIIIGDYNYIFNPKIRSAVLQKAGISEENIILIVDEAHNLPDRIISYMSSSITTRNLEIIIQNLNKREMFNSIVDKLKYLLDKINNIEFNDSNYEVKVSITDFIFEKDLKSSLAVVLEYFIEQNRDDLYELVEEFIYFIDLWNSSDEKSYVHYIKRIKSKDQKYDFENRSISDIGYGKFNKYTNSFKSLTIRCLDPSTISKELFSSVNKTILMSATLAPQEMYVELLGIQNYKTAVLESPFPKQNRKSFILTNATTKYSERNFSNYTILANELSSILNGIKKNAILFFPSYEFKSEISKLLKNTLQNYDVFEESQEMSLSNRFEIIEKMKKSECAVLLAVTLGSFSESINLEGDFLNIVIIVGLPLQKLSFETKSIIKYYDEKYGKGFDYGYYLPSIAKSLQAAGRCIRTFKDKGVIIFYDYRFSYNNYFPYLRHYEPVIVKNSNELLSKIKDFF